MELKEKSIIDILKERVKTSPAGIAIERKQVGASGGDENHETADAANTVLKSYTWRDLDERSDLLAMKLIHFGVQKREHVGIWCFNSEYWIFAFFAVLKTGAVPVLFNTYLSAEELRESARYADCHCVIADERCTRTQYREVLQELRNAYDTRKEPETDAKKHSFERMPTVLTDAVLSDVYREKANNTGDLSKELAKRQEGLVSRQPACMMFTSGTSSSPKGVVLSHFSLVNNARAIAKSMHWSQSDKMCICVPMFHCFGLTAGILSCTVSGATMYILERFKTRDVWNSIVSGGCTILNGVPSMFLAMIRKEEYKDLVPKTLVSGIIAGSPISPGEYLEVCGRLKGARIQPSYGQTETSPCVSIADWEEDIVSKSQNCGRAVEHVEVKISTTNSFDICFQSDADMEACRLLRCGEILVRGYNTMMGYYKRKPEESFTEDGWLKTGDAGYLDEEGRLHITGRIKEMIIRAGENISPTEIEECMKQVNGIKEVKVIGVKADVVQEEILACIIPEKNAKLSDDEIYRFLRKKLASYKIPSEILRFEEFPLTANQKVDVKRLREVVHQKRRNISP